MEILSLEKICRKTAEEKHRKILIRANLYFLIKTVFCLCRSVSAMVACGNVEHFNKPHISTFSITEINGLKMVWWFPLHSTFTWYRYRKSAQNFQTLRENFPGKYMSVSSNCTPNVKNSMEVLKCTKRINKCTFFNPTVTQTYCHLRELFCSTKTFPIQLKTFLWSYRQGSQLQAHQPEHLHFLWRTKRMAIFSPFYKSFEKRKCVFLHSFL